jgi:hypothetical protein
MGAAASSLGSGPVSLPEAATLACFKAPDLWGHDEQSLLAERRSDGAAFAIFSKSHGVPRVDDRRVLGDIIFFNSIGLRCG